MDRGAVPPRLPGPPGQYDQRYMADLVRALETLILQMRSPGEGRNTRITLTDLQEIAAGLEDNAVYDPGVLRRAGTPPELLLGTTCYGQISYQNGQAVTITTVGQYEPLPFTGTLDTAVSEGIGLGDGPNLAIKNTSGRAVRVPVYASYDGKAGNNVVLGLKLALNGVTVDETECRAASGSQKEEAKLVTRWILQLEPDDEVSVRVANFTNTANITISRLRLVVG